MGAKSFMKGMKKKYKKVDNYGRLSETSLSLAEGSIDSGCYVLNGIMTGSLHSGFPVGRITTVSGDSGTGKTLIAAKAAANAQKEGYTVIVVDTEFAWDVNNVTSLGVDPEEVVIFNIGTAEEFKALTSKIIDLVKDTGVVVGKDEFNNDVYEYDKFFLIVDSLGALGTERERDNALVDNFAVDMGYRAQVIKSGLRILTNNIGTCKIPTLITNQVYDDPNNSKAAIKNVSGGKSVTYQPAVMVQFNMSRVSAKKGTESDVLGVSYNGTMIKARTTKNRYMRSFLAVEMLIDFNTGLSKYSGMFDIALKLGIIEGSRTYTIAKTGEKIGYRKDIEKNYEMLERDIVPEVEKRLNEYSFNFSDCETEVELDMTIFDPDEE